MKFLVFSVMLLLILSSCSHKYLLVLQMEPSTEKGANYENDSIKIHFNVTETYIGVKMENKLSRGIKLNWDEVSFSLNKLSYARVFHNLTGLSKINDVQPTTTIPPNSFINDKLYPRETTSVYKDRSGYWSTSTSYFRRKKVNENSEKYLQSRIGNVLVIHMPYYLDNKYVESNFKITIVDVKKIK